MTMNPNVGKKISIPISTSKPVPATPAPSEKASKIIARVDEAVKAADFRPPASSKKDPASSTSPRRRSADRPASRRKTKLKGIYFDLDLLDALSKMHESGQSISRYVNRLVRANLGL